MLRALALVAVLALPARADGYLAKLAETVRVKLDTIAAGRAPKLVPPQPVVVKWKPTRLGSLDLGAPLLAMAAADLDRDGTAELYVVTSREVVGFTIARNRLHEVGRVAFGGERAMPAPRDPVGTAVVENGELVAASSAYAKELRLVLKPGAAGKKPNLEGTVGGAGFLVCPGERASLASGRNYFHRPGDTKGMIYGVRCTNLVDREGYPLRVRGQLGVTGKLAIEVQRCAANGTACQAAVTREYRDSGVAFELADVDRDGEVDVILSGASAPGDADFVKVISLATDDKKSLYKKTFTGGVAGVVAIDGDGDGVTEVLAAVRFSGATRFDVWRLD